MSRNSPAGRIDPAELVGVTWPGLAGPDRADLADLARPDRIEPTWPGLA